MIEFIISLFYSGSETLLEYLSAHVLLCLIPAFFISGAFNALIPDTTIFKFMGNSKNRIKKGITYIFAATSGLILEVCSCTILPLFAGVWKKGAGFGPAITFLFAGPGITLLSTPLTAAVFGVKFAAIKLVLSIIIAILVGVTMEFIFKEDTKNKKYEKSKQSKTKSIRKNYQSILFFSSLLLIMVSGTAPIDLNIKILLVLLFTGMSSFFAWKYYKKKEIISWLKETYKFMKMIFPVLLIGVFVSGMITPLIPQKLIAGIAGENTLLSNFITVLFGTIAYFPTLVEVPIAEMFMSLGMHQGPTMAYLIADPAISIQTLLVVNQIIKPKKTITYALLIILFSVFSGYFYGMFFV